MLKEVFSSIPGGLVGLLPFYGLRVTVRSAQSLFQSFGFCYVPSVWIDCCQICWFFCVAWYFFRENTGGNSTFHHNSLYECLPISKTFSILRYKNLNRTMPKACKCSFLENR